MFSPKIGSSPTPVHIADRNCHLASFNKKTPTPIAVIQPKKTGSRGRRENTYTANRPSDQSTNSWNMPVLAELVISNPTTTAVRHFQPGACSNMSPITLRNLRFANKRKKNESPPKPADPSASFTAIPPQNIQCKSRIKLEFTTACEVLL